MARRTTYLSMQDGEITATLLEADPRRASRSRNRPTAPETAVLLNEDVDAVDSVLLDASRAVPASELDGRAPDRTGLYLFKLRPGATLPEPFESLRASRNSPELLYLGKTEGATLATRMCDQELRGIGHGTFFRSISAVLGFRPEAGSLIGKARPNNFSFTPQDKGRIIEWLNTHVEVAWVALDHHIDTIEKCLIARHTPLLNIDSNPLALTELKDVRAECRRIGLTQLPQ